MPRLAARTGHTSVAFVIVGLFWTAQHRALPFIPDWRYLLFRFLTFLPGVRLLILFDLRTRRVAPLIIAHWPMDIAAALMTVIYQLPPGCDGNVPPGLRAASSPRHAIEPRTASRM
jgi:membrane protease YdiL (CAAX protease family)